MSMKKRATDLKMDELITRVENAQNNGKKIVINFNMHIKEGKNTYT